MAQGDSKGPADPQSSAGVKSDRVGTKARRFDLRDMSNVYHCATMDPDKGLRECRLHPTKGFVDQVFAGS